MGMSGDEAEARELLKTHGRLAKATNSREQWWVANKIVACPARHQHHSGGGDIRLWKNVVAEIRRALRAAEEESKDVKKANGQAQTNGTGTAPAPVIALPSAPATTRDGPLGKVTDLLLEASALAEAWDLEHKGLLEAFNAQGVRLAEADAKVRELDTKLRLKEAEHARFNGRDWPKEVEKLEARLAAQKAENEAEVTRLKERCRRFENVVRELTALGEGAEDAPKTKTTGTTK